MPDGADDEAAIEQKFKAHSGMRAAGAPTHDLTVCGPADLWAGPAPYGIAGDASVHPRLPHEVRRALADFHPYRRGARHRHGVLLHESRGAEPQVLDWDLAAAARHGPFLG